MFRPAAHLRSLATKSTDNIISYKKMHIYIFRFLNLLSGCPCMLKLFYTYEISYAKSHERAVKTIIKINLKYVSKE